MSVIDINKGDKKALRQELKQYFGIEEKMLFEDVYGFALVNNVAHKVDLLKSKEDYLDEALKEKDPSKKIEIYKEALKINSDKDVVYAKMGLAYLELKEPKKAIASCEKALKINPDNEIARKVLRSLNSK